MVKVVAITPDYGLLRTIQVDVDRNGREVFGGSGSKREFIDLQPDGNSFDMLAGLIKTKTT
jgi:biotin--protein ligase